MQQTVFWDSMQFVDTAVEVVVIKESTAMQWILHLVKQGKPIHHQDALHVPEDHGHLLASRASSWPKKFWTAPSAGKQVATVFLDMESILMV
jgi:hypothetical protein